MAFCRSRILLIRLRSDDFLPDATQNLCHVLIALFEFDVAYPFIQSHEFTSLFSPASLLHTLSRIFAKPQVRALYYKKNHMKHPFRIYINCLLSFYPICLVNETKLKWKISKRASSTSRDQGEKTLLNINVCIFEWQWECDDSENPFEIDVEFVGNFRSLDGERKSEKNRSRNSLTRFPLPPPHTLFAA